MGSQKIDHHQTVVIDIDMFLDHMAMPFFCTVNQKPILHQVVVAVEFRQNLSIYLNTIPKPSFNGGGKGYTTVTRPFKIKIMLL